MRCRGIRPEALRKFMIDLGVGETDISISMDSIYAENRKLIDPEANRRFFVWEPAMLTIEGDVPALAYAPLHPTADRGFREIPAGNKLFICKSDLEAFKVGDNIRLKDLCNVEITSLESTRARFLGKDMGKRTKIIHWAPADGPRVTVMKPDGVDEGIGEAGIAEELGKVVQFERYGFVQINSAGEPIVAYFAHR
jgi:glutamyl-tRNA synthetase